MQTLIIFSVAFFIGVLWSFIPSNPLKWYQSACFSVLGAFIALGLPLSYSWGGNMKIIPNMALATSYVLCIIGNHSSEIPKAVSGSWLIATILVSAIVSILQDK